MVEENNNEEFVVSVETNMWYLNQTNLHEGITSNVQFDSNGYLVGIKHNDNKNMFELQPDNIRIQTENDIVHGKGV